MVKQYYINNGLSTWSIIQLLRHAWFDTLLYAVTKLCAEIYASAVNPCYSLVCVVFLVHLRTFLTVSLESFVYYRTKWGHFWCSPYLFALKFVVGDISTVVFLNTNLVSCDGSLRNLPIYFQILTKHCVFHSGFFPLLVSICLLQVYQWETSHCQMKVSNSAFDYCFMCSLYIYSK